MDILTNVDLPIKDKKEALEKFKQIIEDEFKEEVDYVLSNNLLLKENLLEDKNVELKANLYWFINKYIIYQQTMGLTLDSFKKYDLLGNIKDYFPLEAFNIIIDRGFALNIMACGVKVGTAYDRLDRFNDELLTIIEMVAFENKYKKQQEE